MGGVDMTSLFHLQTQYLDTNNTTVSEEITALPWSKTITFKTSCKPSLNVKFSKKENIPNQKSYSVGFSGDIQFELKQTESSKGYNVPLLTKADQNQDVEVIKFKIAFNTEQQARDAVLSVPFLKYNKHFALSYTIDDSSVEAYAKLWRRINKKWIDDIRFFHKRCTPTTGYIPDYPLGYTDGCGNKIRFPVGVAVWPNAKNEWNKNGIIADFSDNTYSPYITWEELSDIIDFGGTVYYHNVDEDKYSKENFTEILKGMAEDRFVTYSKIGRFMKVLALPDGNPNYLLAADNNTNIVMTRSYAGEPKIYLDNLQSLYKKRISTGGNDMSYDQILAEIGSQVNSTNPYWLSFTTHGADQATIKFFEDIDKLYGSNGDDNIWFATFDEVYEYVTMRNGLRIQENVIGNVVEYEVAVPVDETFYYKELSFMASQGVTSVIPVSDNIVGLSNNTAQSGELININFNKRYLTLAEKYTALFESCRSIQIKEDAEYFLSFLLPFISQPYKDRLEFALKRSMEILDVLVNDGDSEVYNKQIQIAFNTKNAPTYYKIWEGDGSGDNIEWKTYNAEEYSFEITPQFGAKKINVQLKDDFSESKISTLVINYKEVPENGIFSKWGIQEYMKKYDGYTWKKQITIK